MSRGNRLSLSSGVNMFNTSGDLQLDQMVAGGGPGGALIGGLTCASMSAPF